MSIRTIAKSASARATSRKEVDSVRVSKNDLIDLIQLEPVSDETSGLRANSAEIAHVIEPTDRQRDEFKREMLDAAFEPEQAAAETDAAPRASAEQTG